MGTCKSVPQITSSGNLHGTETIITVKFKGLNMMEVKRERTVYTSEFHVVTIVGHICLSN